jgi:hypothetical protein
MKNGFCPGGTDDNSPVIDRWERKMRRAEERRLGSLATLRLGVRQAEEQKRREVRIWDCGLRKKRIADCGNKRIADFGMRIADCECLSV